VIEKLFHFSVFQNPRDNGTMTKHTPMIAIIGVLGLLRKRISVKNTALINYFPKPLNAVVHILFSKEW